MRATKGLLRRAWQPVRRVVGYVHSSQEDTRAVYGDHPNGPADGPNLAGNVAGNAIGGIGH